MFLKLIKGLPLFESRSNYFLPPLRNCLFEIKHIVPSKGSLTLRKWRSTAPVFPSTPYGHLFCSNNISDCAHFRSCPTATLSSPGPPFDEARDKASHPSIRFCPPTGV